VVLLLSGTIIIFAAGTSTSSITAVTGEDIDGSGERARRELQAGGTADGYFLPVPILDGGSRRTATILFQAYAGPAKPNEHTESLGSHARAALVARRLPRPLPNRGVHHSLVATRAGQLKYLVKHGLVEAIITSDVALGEHMEIHITDLSRDATTIAIQPDRNRQIDIQLRQRTSVRGDRVAVRLSGIAGSEAEPIEVRALPRLAGVEVRGSDGAEVVAQIDTEVPPGQTRSTKLPLRVPSRIDLSALPHGGELQVRALG
jgi:hypothetical protein